MARGFVEFGLIVWGSCGHASEVLAAREAAEAIKTRLKETPCFECSEVSRLVHEIDQLKARAEAFTAYARLLDA